MKTPIIFVHRGNQEYIKYSLLQASEQNPDSTIYLVGDSSNKHYHNFRNNIVWKSADDYLCDKRNLFVSNYKHMSTNPPHYEIVCIERWFITKEFMKDENLQYAFISDTDVLIYCDIDNIRRNSFSNVRCTLTHNVSAGISFINDSSILEEHCDYVVDCYLGNNPLSFERARTHFLLLQHFSKPGGVCDMTWWGYFRILHPPSDFGESMSIIDAGHGIHSTFDHNINVSYGYEMKNNIKNFKFKEGVPYCYNKTYDLDVKFNCIHFQGQPAKQLMRSFYEIK